MEAGFVVSIPISYLMLAKGVGVALVATHFHFTLFQLPSARHR
jgi:hypothetical protein